MELTRKAGVPITFTRTTSGGFNISGFFSRNYPHNLGFNTSSPNWGCGVQGALEGFGYFLAYKGPWEDEEFIAAWKKLFITGTYIMCITDGQMQDANVRHNLARLKELFIVHECGSFPNYTHSPNNMNLIAVNFNPTRKNEFPVSWDKVNKRETPKPSPPSNWLGMPVAPAVVAKRYIRDAAGRFAKAK